MTRPFEPGEAGFTLIEMIISLALFALISVAGLSLVEAVVRVEEGTAGRLDRLGRFQRALFVISRDLERMSAGSLQQIDGGVQFQSQGSTVYEPPKAVAYVASGGSLIRRAGAEQLLVDQISDVKWSFFFAGRGWQTTLAVDDRQVPIQPTGIAVEFQVDGGAGGSLRRVVELPHGPPPTNADPMLTVVTTR